MNTSEDNSVPYPDPINVAVDAMGGQHAPEEVVAAVAEASTERHPTQSVYFTLIGDETVLTDTLVEHGHNPERIRIRHAPDVVDLGASPEQALSTSNDSSIALACRLVADDRADAVVSAGHPGAAVLAGKDHFDRIAGIDRAALCAVHPTPRKRGPEHDRFSLLLDVGASHEASPSDLHAFALMGSAYARIVTGLEAPEVALLSTTGEPGAGPPDVAGAADRLDGDQRVNFVGTYEGHDIPSGRADVVVCNGYVGNVTIKILEGASEAAFDLARAAYQERLLWKVGLRLLSSGLHQLKRLTDFEEYGGAPLLGLDEVVILAHSRSHRKAIGNALRLAIKNVKSRLPDRIRQLISE